MATKKYNDYVNPEDDFGTAIGASGGGNTSTANSNSGYTGPDPMKALGGVTNPYDNPFTNPPSTANPNNTVPKAVIDTSVGSWQGLGDPADSSTWGTGTGLNWNSKVVPTSKPNVPIADFASDTMVNRPTGFGSAMKEDLYTPSVSKADASSNKAVAKANDKANDKAGTNDNDVPQGGDYSGDYSGAGGSGSGGSSADTAGTSAGSSSNAPVGFTGSFDSQSSYADYAPNSYNNADAYYQDYLNAMQYLQSQANIDPYNNKYADAINGIMDAINNRGAFEYNLNDDALYQQYRDRYIGNAQMSMMDTMGQAAALTGGYGSSYGQAVGQQAYDRTMQGLNDIVPELEQKAYNRYQDEGNRLMQQYGMLTDLEAQDYARWNDAYNRNQNEIDRARANANDAYNRYLTERNNDMNLEQRDYDRYVDGYNRYLTERNFEYNKYNDDYNRYTDERDYEFNKLMQLGASGYTPSADELAAAGLTPEQWGYYAQMLKPQSSGGGGGTSTQADLAKDYQTLLADPNVDYATLEAWCNAVGYNPNKGGVLGTNNDGYISLGGKDNSTFFKNLGTTTGSLAGNTAIDALRDKNKKK